MKLKCLLIWLNTFRKIEDMERILSQEESELIETEF